MKLDANLLDEEVLVGRVVALVHAVSAVPLSRITLAERLREDLGMGEGDGHALMASLHDQFEMDWTGFDLGAHFGSAPTEPRSLTISNLADALRRGRWPVDHSPARRPSSLALLTGTLVMTLAPVFALALWE